MQHRSPYVVCALTIRPPGRPFWVAFNKKLLVTFQSFVKSMKSFRKYIQKEILFEMRSLLFFLMPPSQAFIHWGLHKGVRLKDEVTYCDQTPLWKENSAHIHDYRQSMKSPKTYRGCTRRLLGNFVFTVMTKLFEFSVNVVTFLRLRR